MGILRKATVGKKKIMLDDTDYIEVKTDLPIGDVEDLASDLPEGVDPKVGFTNKQGIQAGHALFKALVVGWSLPEEPTVAEYRLLETDAGAAINEKLVEHFQSLNLRQEDLKSRKTSRSGPELVKT